ncbi:MAG TPA: hypothetical protein VG077_16135 [Verrucomicrobiae bacterium]|nr:hypothetical protein [Verrucomicrobiae bacterium]
MKRFLILLTAGCFLHPITNYGAETAQGRAYCMSLRFQQGTTYGGTLNLSTIGGPPYNGELVPTFSSDSLGDPWGSGLVLVWSGYADSGSIYVNLPLGTDANNDGYDDFFEVSQGVTNEVSTGSYPATDNGNFGGGSVTATWNRAAGSARGTCALYLNDDLWGSLGTFTCPFTLIEYTGPLTYTPGSNSVSAAVNLAQTGNSANTLRGPIIFIKSSTDPFNTLTNQPGVWTNASSQILSFDNEIFSRQIPTWPTNYAGYVYFADGDPSTASPDYQLWVLSINDTNDANANGIPDFSDNPASMTPPRAPQLSLARGSTNLLLTVSGSVGHTNQILGISSLTSTNWQLAQSFLQTNDPQVVSLPLPSGSPKFWRVVAW